jgi:16S rRNA (guanine527-N7)-methyltransferase
LRAATRPPEAAPATAARLGPAYEAVLSTGLAALDLTLAPSVRAAVDRFAELVLTWTERLNLTATRDPAAFAKDHILDSLTAVPLFRARGLDRFLDLGAGAGLPGIPLALAVPATECLLVEATAKKAAFLRLAAGELRRAATIRVAAARVEDLADDPRERGAWPAVTARAVGPLAELVELALPLLRPGGILVAWKAARVVDELPAAERAARTLGGARPELVDPAAPALRSLLGERRLVVVEKVGATPDGFPRRPAVRRRRPW